jgi:hypothetical protein
MSARTPVGAPITLAWHGVALVVGASVAVVACGVEDVELARGDAASESAPEDGGSSTGTLSNDGGALACDGAAPPTCHPLGESCTTSSDCCSVHCDASGKCVFPGACSGANSPCSTRGDCCSGLCEPVQGSTARLCLAECSPFGAPCTRASDCCALACSAGTCGGAECLQEGNDCTSNAQCCSNACDASQGGKCALDSVAPCRPIGEDCTSGGGQPCCSGTCDDTVKRCDPGPGPPCRPIGSVCAQTRDCCHGSCAANPPDPTGGFICTSPPLSDGTSCRAGFECASKTCGGNPPACTPSPVACAPPGSSCDAGTTCCSGQCLAGACQPGCGQPTR